MSLPVTMSRRGLLAVVLCCSLVLAGCSTIGGPSDAEASTGTAPDGSGGAGDAGDGSGGASAGGDGGGDGAAVGDESVVVWDRFAFDEGEFYQYHVTDVENGKDVVLTWEVVEVDGADVTAHVTYDDGNGSFEYTVSGQNASIVTQIAQTAYQEHGDDEAALNAAMSTYGYLSLGPFNPASAYFAARQFEIGNEWKISGNAEDGYMTASVDGRDEYAGKSCYVSKVSVPDSEAWLETGTNEWETCIAPDVGLSLHTAYYDAATGDLVAEISLEEYRSGH